MANRFVYRTLALATAWLLGVGTTATAQRLRVGDTVQMVDSGGRTASGTVRRIESSALTVAVGGHEERWPMSNMRELWKEGDSLRNGMAIGALAGAGGGVLWGLAVVSSAEADIGKSGDRLAGAAVLGIAIGAATGAGIDLLTRGRTLVYRQGSVTLDVSPVVTPGTKGVRLAFRF